MNMSLSVVHKIQELLKDMRNTESLSMAAINSLEKDATYVERCIDILSSSDSEAINNLWREVQYLSRFFGAGYAKGHNQRRLLELMQEFHTALLDDIVAMRAQS